VRANWEGVEIEWHGGRLADITMATRYDRVPHAVECLQIPGYDIERMEVLREPSAATLRTMLRDWMRDHYEEFWENA
jgi:hypothetical protein